MVVLNGAGSWTKPLGCKPAGFSIQWTSIKQSYYSTPQHTDHVHVAVVRVCLAGPASQQLHSQDQKPPAEGLVVAPTAHRHASTTLRQPLQHLLLQQLRQLQQPQEEAMSALSVRQLSTAQSLPNQLADPARCWRLTKMTSLWLTLTSPSRPDPAAADWAR